MWNILSIILGNVAANKIRLRIGATKRNPLTQIAVTFRDNYAVTFKKSNEIGKIALIVLPLTNLFILSGLFSFLIVVAIDYALVRYILNK